MPKNQNKSWHNFLSLFKEAKNSQDLDFLLDIFLTRAEKEDLARRYEILTMLLENKSTQRKIAKALNVSIAKVTRGSNILKSFDKEKLKLFYKLINK